MADNSLVYRKSRVKECLTGKRAKFSVDRYSYRPANRATHSATHQPNTIFKYIAVSNFDRAERPSGHTATIQLHRVHALHFEQDLRQDKIPAFGPLSLYLDIYIWGRTQLTHRITTKAAQIPLSKIFAATKVHIH